MPHHLKATHRCDGPIDFVDGTDGILSFAVWDEVEARSAVPTRPSSSIRTTPRHGQNVHGCWKRCQGSALSRATKDFGAPGRALKRRLHWIRSWPTATYDWRESR